MSKRKKRKYSISRRINGALWGSEKDPYYKRNYPPGMHGIKGYKRTTEYGYQLIAKQKLKKYYGEIKEKQFRRIYEIAKRRDGTINNNLVGMLESRIDVFLYKCNFASTIFLSRQLVNHKHIQVNRKIVNLPSYTLRPGDVITIKKIYKNEMLNEKRELPNYMAIDLKSKKSIYLKIPSLNDIKYPVEMNLDLVSEFYSR